MSVASEPLFTTTNAFKFTPLSQRPVNKKEKVTLVGNLCTTTDIIAENLIMPYLRPGDVIAISNAGAYGAVLSPMQFSSHNDIKEFLI
ncbi:hypothetical protein [Limosilactobacillus vaginalis]|uniref:hypothetical protein n=1 Tax=Limosilactobacillus vaginalis TaxID=1633 RepID=UPI003C6DA661